jgi:hypothetical protein
MSNRSPYSDRNQSAIIKTALSLFQRLPICFIDKNGIFTLSIPTALLFDNVQSGNYGVGLVYGSITVEYLGNNSFRILPDMYDFDIHANSFFSRGTIKRNIETIGAGILHGSGTPFKIIFNGLYHNK